jgi:Na+/melibiose symporter-like transporter
MNPLIWMSSVWGLVTLFLVVLLIYKSRLTRQETDWIPLTDDAREERAIKTQSVIEMKTQKLVWPIRTLTTLSVILLFVILAYWIYTGVMTPPPPPS